MCIKIVKEDSEISYDPQIPLENQIKDSEEIFINYNSKDESIGKFLSEMERICAIGINLNVKINFVNTNSIEGARTKRKVKKIKKDLNINEAIKLLTSLQLKTDKTLQELAVFCRK